MFNSESDPESNKMVVHDSTLNYVDVKSVIIYYCFFLVTIKS